MEERNKPENIRKEMMTVENHGTKKKIRYRMRIKKAKKTKKKNKE